jgi:hypothetical protein
VRGDVPALLIAHVERALRPDPSARFDSASAMIGALTKLLHAEIEPSGPEAIAASVASILDRPKPEARPQGLAEVGTMHVDLAELTVLPRRPEEPPQPEEPREPDAREEPDASTEAEDSGRRPRYRFGYKEKRAKLAEREERRLTPEPSEAQPLPLAKPKGLVSNKTEFLDPDQVDRLTLPEIPAKKPTGLAPQRTEFLDESQVDRLTLPTPKKPKG